jgi:hypothetical protein
MFVKWLVVSRFDFGNQIPIIEDTHSEEGALRRIGISLMRDNIISVRLYGVTLEGDIQEIDYANTDTDERN